MISQTSSSEETKIKGVEFGRNLKGGEILAFCGDLGCGKTTFIQGLAQGLKIEKKINSPTFNLMKQYSLTRESSFYHLDLYRIDFPQQIISQLGLTEIWSDPKNIIAIEWAEKIKQYLPQKTIWLKFRYLSPEKREIEIKI